MSDFVAQPLNAQQAKIKSRPIDKIIERIRNERGLAVRIAEACGIQRTAVYQWTQVPVARVQIVAAILKMKPEQIRPDIFKTVRLKKRRR